MKSGNAGAPARRYAVIMAGGVGARFWPHSRRHLPKQFLAIGGRRTLLQQTADRLRGVVPVDHVLVVAGREFVPRIRAQLPGLPRANVLIEPAARSTAPCLALAAAWIARRDPAALMIALPADHVIDDVPAFRRAVLAGFRTAAESDYLVTFGVAPKSAETGYGYIETGAALRGGNPRVWSVARFVEKPDRQTAERFVRSGRHLWNAGIFVWRVAALRAAFERYAPPIARVMAGFEGSARSQAAARRAFSRLPAVSIDVAVMERAERVATVAATFGWSDVGSWAAMPELWGADGAGNATRGETLLVDCRDTVAYGATRLIAVLGGRDLVVVDSPDAVLVCPRSRAQEVRRIVDALARGPRRHLR